MKINIIEVMPSLFPLGQVFATLGVMEACSNLQMLVCLKRHMTGDWGCMEEEDRESNDDAIESGRRIISVYPIDPAKPSKGYGDNTMWIITAADRRTTTVLLADEYVFWH